MPRAVVHTHYKRKPMVTKLTTYKEARGYRRDSAPRPPFISHMLPKTIDSLGYIFVADSTGLTAVNLTQLSPKPAVLREVTPNDGHWVVQGHSRSPILIPIDSWYTT